MRMEYVVEKGPEYAVLRIKLSPGERVTVEPGSYMMHKGEIEVETSTGGIFGAITRTVLGGESIFLNTFRARGPAEIWVAPSIPGDIHAIRLSGEEINVQDTSYLAHVGDIKYGIAFRGFKGFISEGEIFWLKIQGHGTVFVNSFGAIDQIELAPGERVIVDNGHLVAIERGVKWNIRKLGGFKTFFLGGEGLVVELEGPGRAWVQTRTLAALAQALSKYILKGGKK